MKGSVEDVAVIANRVSAGLRETPGFEITWFAPRSLNGTLSENRLDIMGQVFGKIPECSGSGAHRVGQIALCKAKVQALRAAFADWRGNTAQDFARFTCKHGDRLP